MFKMIRNDAIGLFMRFFFLLVLVLTWAFGAIASPCNQGSVKKISVPVYPDRKESANFTFSFQYFPAANVSMPTIVVIPGGPGLGLIDHWTDDAMEEFGLPEGAGLVFLDPRTVGCNSGDEKKFPDDSLNSVYLAHDILSALQSIGVKDFVLYGHSYGSVLATVTAGLAQKRNMPARSVVLTGIVSKWSQGIEGSVYWGLKTEWEKLRDKLPVHLVQRLKKKEMPFGFSEDTWAEIIENGLYLGQVLRDGRPVHPLRDGLLLLAEFKDDEAMEVLSEIIPDKAEGGDWSQRLFDIIDCGELTDTEPTNTLRSGEWVTTGDDCSKRPTLIRPFDSRDYLTSSPVFYFAGTAEAVTFYRQARHHFEHYEMSDRYLVSIKDGGHNRIGLYFNDCKEKLWNSIFSDGLDFKEALDTCEANRLGINTLEFTPRFPR